MTLPPYVIRMQTWGGSGLVGFYDQRRQARPANPKKQLLRYHHSVTVAPDLVPPFGDEVQAMWTLHNIGVQRFGSGISYNFAIMPTGNIYEGMPLDVKSTQSGHTVDANYVEAAVVFVGNYEAEKMPQPMVDAAVRLHADLHVEGYVADMKAHWHSQVYATSCPGQHAKARMMLIQIGVMRRVAQIRAGRDDSRKPVVSLPKVVRAARRDRGRWSKTLPRARHVKVVERALVAEGLLDRRWVDGRFGEATVEAYTSWQRRCGFTGAAADGVPGEASLAKLGDRRGFVVRL